MYIGDEYDRWMEIKTGNELWSGQDSS
jgi:hypothetical protein